MIKKHFILLILSCLSFLKGYAQDSPNDSYTIQRLLIFNSNGEMLMEQHPNGWMTPALRHQTQTPIREGLFNLAAEYGIQISPPKLVGFFLFMPEYKAQASHRQFFRAEAIGGELVLPEGKLQVAWFSPEQVIEVMGDPNASLVGAVREMIQQILDNPGEIWGGSFRLWREDDMVQYAKVEDFYTF